MFYENAQATYWGHIEENGRKYDHVELHRQIICPKCGHKDKTIYDPCGEEEVAYWRVEDLVKDDSNKVPRR